VCVRGGAGRQEEVTTLQQVGRGGVGRAGKSRKWGAQQAVLGRHITAQSLALRLGSGGASQCSSHRKGVRDMPAAWLGSVPCSRPRFKLRPGPAGVGSTATATATATATGTATGAATGTAGGCLGASRGQARAAGPGTACGCARRRLRCLRAPAAPALVPPLPPAAGRVRHAPGHRPSRRGHPWARPSTTPPPRCPAWSGWTTCWPCLAVPPSSAPGLGRTCGP
jgi:hypothetical protein